MNIGSKQPELIDASNEMNQILSDVIHYEDGPITDLVAIKRVMTLAMRERFPVYTDVKVYSESLYVILHGLHTGLLSRERETDAPTEVRTTEEA